MFTVLLGKPNRLCHQNRSQDSTIISVRLEIFRITSLHLLIIHYSGKHLLNMQNENDKSMFNTSQLYLLYKDIVFLFAFKHEEILFIILWHYDYSLHFSLNYLAYIFLFDGRFLTLNFYFYFL